MLYAVAPLSACPSDRRFFASGWANSEIKRNSALLMTGELGIRGQSHKWEYALSGLGPPHGSSQGLRRKTKKNGHESYKGPAAGDAAGLRHGGTAEAAAAT